LLAMVAVTFAGPIAGAGAAVDGLMARRWWLVVEVGVGALEGGEAAEAGVDADGEDAACAAVEDDGGMEKGEWREAAMALSVSAVSESQNRVQAFGCHSVVLFAHPSTAIPARVPGCQR